jgi:predicted phosphoadenosine phosphosulfate sulfurtransferase
MPDGQVTTFLSFGGGHDSTAILLKLIHDETFRQQYAPDRLIVIFSDTGNERPATYTHIAKMEQLLIMCFSVPCQTHMAT